VPKSSLLTVRLQKQNDPVSRTKGSRFFPQRAFISQATPDLARGLKPTAHRALTTKQQINNQQQTTNTTSKFLLTPSPFSSPLLPGIALKAPFSPSHRSLAGTDPHQRNFKAHTAKE
jgi:hypothetical protein